MNFESFSEKAPKAESEPNRDKIPAPIPDETVKASKKLGAGKWLKKQAALAGVIGMGFLSTNQAEAFPASAEIYKDAKNFNIEKVGEQILHGAKKNVYSIKDLKGGQEVKFLADSDKEAEEKGPAYFITAENRAAKHPARRGMTSYSGSSTYSGNSGTSSFSSIRREQQQVPRYGAQINFKSIPKNFRKNK